MTFVFSGVAKVRAVAVSFRTDCRFLGIDDARVPGSCRSDPQNPHLLSWVARWCVVCTVLFMLLLESPRRGRAFWLHSVARRNKIWHSDDRVERGRPVLQLPTNRQCRQLETNLFGALRSLSRYQSNCEVYA